MDHAPRLLDSSFPTKDGADDEEGGSTYAIFATLIFAQTIFYFVFFR